MAAVMFSGPVAKTPLGWCGWCSALFKKAVMDAVQDEIQAALRSPEPEVWVDMAAAAREHGIPLPEPAVAVGPCIPMNGAVAGTCWSHEMGMMVTALAPASADMVPLLRKG